MSVIEISPEGRGAGVHGNAVSCGRTRREGAVGACSGRKAACVSSRREMSGRRSICLVAALLLCVPGIRQGAFVLAESQRSRERADRVVARVNGRPIRWSELLLQARLQGVAESELVEAETRDRLLREAVDRALLREYLDDRRVPIPERETRLVLKTIEQRLQREGKSLEDVIGKVGLTREDAERIVGLQLRWAIAARRMIGEREIRAYWNAHRAELDGTRVRVRHIVVRVPAGGDDGRRRREDARRLLQEVRRRILAGELSFEEAARRYSDAPSKDNGGDLGFIPFRGAVLPEVARVAFRTPVGQISGPFESPVGVHLIQIVARQEGELSLEDARPEIFKRLAVAKQAELLDRLRHEAQIEILR
ncbi:MAG: hypothetical protein D6725_04690 [Planctomycetota bacterium]|nr:MAG: hypothetical protein D6725_04690 [Planctomycetota bacterium]